MSQHDGVSCDSCLKNNFLGKRYKCLICFDYDLCASCHDSGVVSARHASDHPMQCILTRSDLDLFFAGEILSNDQPKSFTCPLCGRLGFTDTSLYDHVNVSHSDTEAEVLCPICATLPGGDPNQVTDDFLSHLNVEHRNRESEEPQIIRIRNRHNNHNHTRLNNNRSRRSQIFNTSTVRDNIDPIAQLLNQLNDVRRINNGASTGVGAAGGGATGAQTSMQFHFDRQSATGAGSNRIPLERIIQRQRRQTSSSQMSTSHAESILSSQLPYMVLLDSTTSPTFGGVGSGGGGGGGSGASTASTSVSNPNQPGAGFTHLAKSTAPNFLLAKLSNLPSSASSSSSTVENERKALDVMKADRSIFLQELIFASLSESTPIDELVSLKCNKSVEEVKISGSNGGVESSSGEAEITSSFELKVDPVNGALFTDSPPRNSNNNTEEESVKKSTSTTITSSSSSNGNYHELSDMSNSENGGEVEHSRCPEDRVHSDSCKQHLDSVKCVEVMSSATMADSVQSLLSPASPLFAVSQPPTMAGHNNRNMNNNNKTQSKGRSPSAGTNRAPLTLRSSFPGTGPNLNMSPNGGRRKVLKHPAEPPTN